MLRKIRVLVGKPGLDGHDRGAKVVAAALRDAGMEVIYTGLHQSPEQIVEAALQEDVDVVALSILSGAHMTLFPEVLELMRRRGIGDRLLTGGGIIPPEDMEALANMGVGRLFGPGTSTQDIAFYIREWFDAEHGGAHDAAMRTPGAPPATKTAATREPTPQPQPRIKAKPKAKPKAKIEAKPKVKTKAKRKPKTKAKPTPKPVTAAARRRKASRPRRKKSARRR